MTTTFQLCLKIYWKVIVANGQKNFKLLNISCHNCHRACGNCDKRNWEVWKKSCGICDNDFLALPENILKSHCHKCHKKNNWACGKCDKRFWLVWKKICGNCDNDFSALLENISQGLVAIVTRDFERFEKKYCGSCDNDFSALLENISKSCGNCDKIFWRDPEHACGSCDNDYLG